MPELLSLFEGGLKDVTDKGGPDVIHSLFAPSHDTVTSRTCGWADEWKLSEALSFLRHSASHKNAISRLKNPGKLTHTMAFICHGSPEALFTDAALGKPSSAINKKGCLLESDDVRHHYCSVNIVAWACYSGRQFGREVCKCRRCGFFGFTDKISMIIFDSKSEQLWSNLIRDLLIRIMTKNRVDLSDKVWFQGRIDQIMEEIRSGKINTGKFNVFNLGFLARLRKDVVVYS